MEANWTTTAEPVHESSDMKKMPPVFLVSQHSPSEAAAGLTEVGAGEGLGDLVGLDVRVLRASVVGTHALEQELLLLVAESLGLLGQVGEDPDQRDPPEKSDTTRKKIHVLPGVHRAAGNMGQAVVYQRRDD